MLCPTAYSQCIASRPQLPPLSLPYTAPSDVANGLFLWEICLYLIRMSPSVPFVQVSLTEVSVNTSSLSLSLTAAHASNLN